jgi:hypothetical protein
LEEGPTKTMKTSDRISDVPAEILTKHLHNTSLQNYLWTNLLSSYIIKMFREPMSCDVVITEGILLK